MTTTDPIPDRSELRRRATTRIRLLLLAPALLLLSVIGGFALGFGTSSEDHSLDAGLLLVLGGILLVAAGIGVVFVVLIRRRLRHPDLTSGLDRRTQRAVNRALRAGRTSDPRIDAIIRESVGRAVNQRWTVSMFVLAAAFNAMTLTWRIQDREWDLAALGVVTTAMFAAFAVYRWVTIGRMRAYVRQPGPAEVTDTAA